MSKVQNLERLIVQVIKTFKNDPPATRYELGYFNALKDLLEDAGVPVPRYLVGRRAPKPRSKPRRRGRHSRATTL